MKSQHASGHLCSNKGYHITIYFHLCYSTRITTRQSSAPASLTAHPRQPLRLRLMIAFHPASAQAALAKISASDPNRLARDSRCILPVAGPSWPGGGDIGDVGVDCGVGDRETLVTQSMTSTRGLVLWVGVREGRRAGVFSRRDSRVSERRRRSSERWMTV